MGPRGGTDLSLDGMFQEKDVSLKRKEEVGGSEEKSEMRVEEGEEYFRGKPSKALRWE